MIKIIIKRINKQSTNGIETTDNLTINKKN